MLIRKVSSHDNEPRKSTLPNWAVIPIILVIIAGFLFMPKMEHIADTNGADNFALSTLTEEDIFAKTLTCTGGPNYSTGRLVLPGPEYFPLFYYI